MSENIKVVVRVRPCLSFEAPATCCIENSESQVTVGGRRTFAFDHVFGASSASDEIFAVIGKPLTHSFLEGYNVSTIAYGQTGAGKTFTMTAITDAVSHEIFTKLKEEFGAMEGNALVNVRVSALEVYNDNLRDLLVTNKIKASSPTKNRHVSSPSNSSNGGGQLALREDPKGGVCVPGLQETEVFTAEDLCHIIGNATANRKTASTLMNATSSRSHCVVTISLLQSGITSKFCLVDLAGSERLKKSLGSTHNSLGTGLVNGAVGNEKSGSPSHAVTPTEIGTEAATERMKEGISINSGLLALGNVITALCEGKPYIPYRSSKLTRLLQPMLSGNSKTVMIACVSPIDNSFEESLNTLKYANRAKSIKTTPFMVVSDFSSQEEAQSTILSLRQELQAVKDQLEAYRDHAKSNIAPSPAIPINSPQLTALNEENAQRVAQLEDLLLREQRNSKRLEEEVFNAEYTAMVEVEKRKAIEAHLINLETELNNLLEKESMADNKQSTSWLSSALTPKSRQNQENLGKLESERNNLIEQKNAKEEVQKRLNEEIHAVEEPSYGGTDQLMNALTLEIEGKRQLIQELEERNQTSSAEIGKYQQALADLAESKAKLESELAKAAAKLEQSEQVRNQKEEKRERLDNEYKEKLRKAEEVAAEYRRRVKQIESEMASRTANIAKMKSLQDQVEKLREELNKQRLANRKEQRRSSRLAIEHTQEIEKLHREKRETEDQLSRLQNQLQKKEQEINKVKNNAIAASNASNITPRSNIDSAKSKYSRTRQSRSNSVSTNDTVDANRLRLQSCIDSELACLDALEEERTGFITWRRSLQSALDQASVNANYVDQFSRAIKGFTMGIDRITKRLEKEELTPDLRKSLERERDVLIHKRSEIELAPSLFEQGTQELAEVENRMDSIDEARKYHLQRIREFQRAYTEGLDMGDGASLKRPSAASTNGMAAAAKNASNVLKRTAASDARKIAQLEATVTRLRNEVEELRKLVPSRK